jgi:hypothetical protein
MQVKKEVRSKKASNLEAFLKFIGAKRSTDEVIAILRLTQDRLHEDAIKNLQLVS